MAALLLGLAALRLLLASAAPPAAPPLAGPVVERSGSQARAHCQSLLHGVAKAGRSDFELAAHCRARLPEGACHTARSLLGSQPWKPERMDAACEHWEAERRLYVRQLAASQQSAQQDPYADLQQNMDQLVKAKAALSLVANGTTGTVGQDLNSVVQQKVKISKELEKAINMKYEMWGQAASAYGDASKQTGAQPFTMPWQAPGFSLSSLGLIRKWQQADIAVLARPATALVCLMALAPLVGAAVLVVRRRLRRRGSIAYLAAPDTARRFTALGDAPEEEEGNSDDTE